MVDIDPELKQELHAALEQEGISLKQWFMERAKEHLRHHGQLSLQLTIADGDPADRKYR